MIKKAKRYFNTSGPNIPGEHYTLKRENLIEKGLDLVNKKRYFTIWAPRQTGKSTYFRMLAAKLEKTEFKVTHVNLENYGDVPLSALFNYLFRKIKEDWGVHLNCDNFGDLQNDIAQVKDKKCILIIDEIEGLNPEYFGQFLHTIRNLYHSREDHCLKSVILVGVSNIVGVVEDNSSPFNIADNLEVPYFSTEETHELLHMHEEETGQLFHQDVKEKITGITANQPGLVNGFAYKLVERFPAEEIIGYDHYLEVEDWTINIAVDKNISNIVNKAKKYRLFVEGLLFNDKVVKFRINDDKIRFLSSYGVIKNGPKGNVVFNVPLYKKALIDAFYPFSNGESDRFFRNVDFSILFNENGRLKFDLLIDNYKNYVKRRSFKYFREKDKDTGLYKSIKEAALAYSFETYIQTLVQISDGKSYLEPHTGLGRSDLILNIQNHEYVVEFKIFRDNWQFEKGKKQLAYYSDSIGIKEGIYLVFVPNTVTLPTIKDKVETISGIEIRTYIVSYDEEKDF
ncbi:MAG: ATP-binding protein [bacterium]|nr:ATP-binding protein [bacterium]